LKNELKDSTKDSHVAEKTWCQHNDLQNV